MRRWVLITLFMASSSHAGWSQKARDFLPASVNKLQLGQSDRDFARKHLGKPALVKGDKEYWVFDGFKYALELTFKSNKLETIHFNFPEKKFSVEALKEGIDPKLMKPSPSSPHTSLVYEDREGRLEIDLATGKLESVRLR